MNRLQHMWYHWHLSKFPYSVPYEDLSKLIWRKIQLQITANDITLWKIVNPRFGAWWHCLWWRRGIRFVKTEIHNGKVWRYYKHVKTEYAGCWLQTEKIRIWFKKI